MSESNPTSPYLSVDFGEQGGRYEWKSYEDAESWITQLQNQWKWVSGLGQQSTNILWKTINNNLQQSISNLQQEKLFRSNGNAQQADQQLGAARTALESHLRQFPWLLPNSAQRRFVEEIRDSRGALEAALIAANWIGQDLNGAPISHVVNALLQWELYERGIKDRMKAESTSLKRLAGEMQTNLTQHQETERVLASRFDALHEGITNHQAALQITFDEAQQQRADTWELQRNAAQKELDNIKITYDQHMALAAPVEYWETKRIKHRNMTWGAGLAVITGMMWVGNFLSSKMESIHQSIAVTPHSPQSIAASSVQAASSVLTTSSVSATWHLGTFLMLAVLSFWVIRLLVRIFLSNMHLENDAAERVTMAKTYLALIRSDSLSKSDNIDTVLAALFRPTGDGIVKDEGLPPSAMELFTKLGR